MRLKRKFSGVIPRSKPWNVWQAERGEHRQRVDAWIRDRVERSLRGEKHPVYDFLFEYYSFRPAHLQRYSPGMGVLLEQAGPVQLDWVGHYTISNSGAMIETRSFPVRRLPMVRWCIQFLQATLERQPVFNCFGLHEWAMVYRSETVRHARIPLRLAPIELAQFVEGQNICCTHFDAFRFFTPHAVPLNRYQLNRYSTLEHDQPGCIHANMDLYKWAFTLAPFISSRLIADAFELAWQAREIDMRASPYDLSSFGFSPIAIETKSGREEYINWQRHLYERSLPVRKELFDSYRSIEKSVSAHVATLGAFSNGSNS